MGIATTLAIGAGVAAIGAGVSAAVQKNAANKAANAQSAAIKRQEALLKDQLNPQAVNSLALEADQQRAQNRLDLQQKIDPELAKARTLGKQQLLDVAQQDRAGAVEGQLFKEQFTADPRMEALKSELIARAQDDLSRGATLPPEFQAELVRSGLSSGAASGFAIDPRTIGGSTAHAIGSAGIALQQQRQQEASQAIDQAQKITDARTNILANIFPKVEAFRQATAAGTFQTADNALPEAGLGGQDIANLQLAKVNAQSKLEQQKGQVAANKAQAQGQFISGLVGAGAGAISGIAGAYNSAGTVTPALSAARIANV